MIQSMKLNESRNRWPVSDDMTVSELMDRGGRAWNEEMPEDLFTEEVKERIRRITPAGLRSNMMKRHIAKDQSCSRCAAEEESINHLLFQCPCARLIRAVSPFHPLLNVWLKSCVEDKPDIKVLANKHIEKAATSQRERVVLVITGDTNDHVISVNPYDFHNKTFGPSLNRKGILIAQKNSDKVGFVQRVFHCNGLLLCIWRRNKRRLLVYNPYWGKTRWIECPRQRSYEMFAFGYDKSCASHKIVRLSTSDKDKQSGKNFLQCFDFTREGLGPLLPISCEFFSFASLSSVKEEKLALLFKHQCGTKVDVWVTDKIEPGAVSWSKLFKVETLQLLCHGCMFGSFLIDKEKKTVVVFYIYGGCYTKSRYIIDGESGDIRQVERIVSQYSNLYNLVGCYVPSSVQV
uniref:F-box associated domain-containing protein n=1 Tax=Brassica oleracea var. oleracea TaxID=109376 RepID=A0A0D3CHY4_BRAOL